MSDKMRLSFTHDVQLPDGAIIKAGNVFEIDVVFKPDGDRIDKARAELVGIQVVKND